LVLVAYNKLCTCDKGELNPIVGMVELRLWLIQIFSLQQSEMGGGAF